MRLRVPHAVEKAADWARAIIRAAQFTNAGVGAFERLVLHQHRLHQRIERVRRARQVAIASSVFDQALAAFARFETALDSVRLGRSHESSIHELLASLVVNWPGGLPDPARTHAALVVVERVLYDATPVPEAAVQAAAATLDELAALARTVDLATTS